jgi:hypothetical protein
MITIVKNKNFSNVLDEVAEAIKSHSSYRTGFHKIAATHFVSSHVLPQGESKHVEIHHLVYNLYYEIKA